MNLKGNKAITLVALIITIIVLLILAGVTLNMVLGENGLINKAQSSVDKYQQSSVNEQKLLNSIEEYFDSNVQRDKKLTLSATSGTCTYPNTLSFTVTNNPSGGTITAISSDTNVATVGVDGNTITLTPKNVNGTATITVKSAATGNYEEKNAMYTVTVNKNTAYVTATEIEASPTTYYGKKVTNYTAGGATWRIFYVDSTGKYGEKDTIYLKADYDDNRKDLLDKRTFSRTDILAKMNAEWWKNRGSEPNSWGAKEKEVAYLCDPTNWTAYCNQELANYAIGTPSLEMYVDSFNKTHGTNRLRYKYEAKTFSGYNTRYGYWIGNSTTFYDGPSNDLGVLVSESPTCGGIYYTPQKSWWIASSVAASNHGMGNDACMYSIVDSGKVSCGDVGNLGYSPGANYGICPIVSLKIKTIQIE